MEYYNILISILHNVVAVHLRYHFLTTWDNLYPTTPWDDDDPVCLETFIRKETDKTRARRTLKHVDHTKWDLTVLFYVLINSDSVGNHPPGPVRDAIQNVRVVRNNLSHANPSTIITNVDYVQQYNVIKTLFSVLGITYAVQHMKDIEVQQMRYRRNEQNVNKYRVIKLFLIALVGLGVISILIFLVTTHFQHTDVSKGLEQHKVDEFSTKNRTVRSVDLNHITSSNIYLFEQDHRYCRKEYQVYKENLFKLFPQVKCARFTGLPTSHLSILDLLSASLSLRHINNHFYKVRLYNFSKTDHTKRRDIQEYMCSLLFDIAPNKEGFKPVSLVTEAYENDYMMLVVDTSVSSPQMQSTEVITIVADVNDITLIAIIFDLNDDSYSTTHDSNGSFSQNFGSQIKARNFKVSPLSKIRRNPC